MDNYECVFGSSVRVNGVKVNRLGFQKVAAGHTNGVVRKYKGVSPGQKKIDRNNEVTGRQGSTVHRKYCNRASTYVMLLSNLIDEHRGLTPVSEAGSCHQLALVPPTEYK